MDLRLELLGLDHSHEEIGKEGTSDQPDDD